ncbi:MAG: putative Ig domain-containing protein [Flavobacterium sp.]|nr:putative Ig domain-containing protein [Flavobacterium sp.]
MKKITLGLLALLFAVQSIETKAQTVVINEILASNNVSIQDEDSSHQDWIELYNTGSTSVNLLGFGLSDDPLLLYKWTFPNVSLGAGQYLIVWASDKNRSVAGSPLHTNFKISASGEALYLTNTVGTTISTVPAANLQADISYGKYPNGTGPYVFFGTPTPNAVNATAGFSQALNPPVFSQSSGFLTAGFNLTISSPDPGTTILYTLDGSEPDENNLSGTTYNYKNQYPKNPGQAFGPFLYNSFTTLQYSAPIAIADRSSQANKVSAMSTTYDFTPPYIPNGPIYKGNIIRAKVIKPGALSSKVVTKNYFITPSGPAKYSLPVLSFSFTENQLYDYEDGIAVAGVDFDNWRTANPNEIPDREFGNFERSGIENERKANMHYFVNGLEKINQDVGIRIRGAYSRVYPSKSWNIAARSDFGDDNMSYKFFADEPYTSYERLSAKSGGSDFYNTMFRDAMNHQLVKDLRMETESFQPMVVFMNGEYWGLLNMREKYDNNYFKQVYNIDAVDLLENQGAIQEGDAVDYNNMYSYISSNTFTSDANYAYIQTRMDTDNFIDYFTTNIFAQNDDWPGNNIIYWRKKTAGFVPNAPYGHDGRWRWAIHDMDSTLDDPNYNSLQDATSTIDVGPNPSWSTLILRKLLANTTFKNDFINRFADLMNTNFLSTRIVAKIDEISAIIAPEMPDQYFRWKAPLNNSDWQYHLNEEKEFANERPAFQRSHIRSKFSISSNINATLNVSNYNHGYVKISTIEIKDGTPGITGNPYPWTGIYFSGIPLKLKAIAKPGYIFSNWTGASTSTNAEITITPTANFSITAVFVPDGITDVSVPIYFWMMDGNIVNGAQLTSLNSTYELASNGVIQYQSCNTGYPTTNAGKSSMERRNNPTTINYRQTVNGNIPYATSDMKGLQIKQPFQSGGLENTMVFNFSTLGYKKIKFSFAGVDEGAASAIAIDYAVNAGTPIWITTGLTSSSLPLTAVYQLFEVDFSTISTVDNNSNFKIRLRFTGPNMTADLGNRVTFNNIAVDGVKIPLSYPSPNIFNVGTAITNLAPSTTRVMTSYSIAPSLPDGLTLNTTSGIISGTPTAASVATNYTVTGTYASGTETFVLNITVNDSAPTSLTYASPNIFTKGVGIATLTPTSSGGAVVSYSVSPSLPAGLSLDVTTGAISGIPTAITSVATYTVTAINSGGSTSFGVVITVKDLAPSALSYTSPNIFTKSVAIANLVPTSSGGAVVNYTVFPTLPAGLSLNNTTGVISGTPTTISGTANYTVTANNTGGSTNFGISIRVNDVAPSALSYNSPNIYTRGITITSLNPAVSGGAVTSYSISPSLPSGLSFSTSTGRISGTPTAIAATATYTVTATNTGGSTTFGVVITVNDIAPNALTYTSPNVFTRGTTISNLNPSVSGGIVTSYSITPSLPSGLSFSTSTGRISGTPTAIAATATYTVTATNTGGSTTFGVVITVNDIAPSTLSYISPNVFTLGSTIIDLTPIVSGTVLNYSISPVLPNGLSFETSTGIISGTPTAIAATATYTVTAFNSGGSTTFGVVITVNDIAPSALTYTSPNVFTRGTTISNLDPTISGGIVTSYSISPSLPSGLSFSTSTGRISGTPTAIAATATYTVTAFNSGGSTTFGVVITVNDIAPSALTYTSPNVFTRGTTISNLDPTISGGIVASYSISPSLPTGLSFSTSTGRISGTPTAIAATATYTVTAFNSGGSTTFGVVITVNDIAPSALSYISPNVFTRGTTISNLDPTISGGIVTSYSISPSLPSGLSFSTSTEEFQERQRQLRQ